MLLKPSTMVEGGAEAPAHDPQRAARYVIREVVIGA
jgi:hypothetical protein